MNFRHFHFGRSWSDNRLERTCPCTLEPCGLVSYEGADPNCEEHYKSAKSMRQIHPDTECPGPRPNHPVTKEVERA